MKFTTNSKELFSSLMMISKAIGSNPVLPILDFFHFTVFEKSLTIRATDLEITMIQSIPCNTKEAGEFSICVPSKLIMNTLKGLANQEIEFTVDFKNMGIVLKSVEGKYKMGGEDAKEFPGIPELKDVKEYLMDKDDLFPAFHKALACVGSDDMRPAMQCVLFRVNKTDIDICSTDANKLYHHVFQASQGEPAKALIPKKGISTLLTTPISETMIQIKITPSQVVFNFDNTVLFSRLVDYEFPKFEAIIPDSSTRSMNVVKEDFRSSMKRVSLYADSIQNLVVMNINGELKMNSKDTGFSLSAVESIPCEFQGEEITIGINHKFMNSIIRTIGDESILMEMNDHNQAIIIKADKKENERSLFLLMPVMFDKL